VRWLFFGDRSEVLRKYHNIFSPVGNREGDDNDQQQGNKGVTLQDHYGWFLTLYNLSETNILSITGDKALTELNFIFVLNYLSLQHELNEEEKRRIAQQTRTKIL